MKAKQVWGLPTNLKVKLEINQDNIVVGTNQSLLVTRFLGLVARRKEYCPIDVEEWSQMPLSIKDNLWALIKEKFSFNYDAGEYWALKILGKSWKRWKYDLRTKYLVSKKLKKELLENTPPEVDDVQWSKFIDHYQSDRMKETSEKNTVKRKKLQINHTGGTKSNQRRAYEMVCSNL
ncbi:hypothetical protein L195_g019302 [Trifolium pratense]|uniref:Uncharacterized protein n=1 Tax=Trifolium pratense TaxID=57577 RepID=A0A2K3MZ73_TRIPR|nr:hypothetical protein L195_g019302 [Trifolium pratense]